MIIRNEIETAAAKQLSTDLNCSPDDFFKYENTVTLLSAPDPKSRRLSEHPHFFRAATMGMGAVICSDSKVTPFAKMLAASRRGSEICSADTAAMLDRELFSYGYYIGIMNQYYLPRSPYYPKVRCEGYSLTVLENEDIEELYSHRGFNNALLYRRTGDRYDVLAVCAVNGRRIMGIAGASRDSSSMAQIGIDVLPEYRGMGVGSALVSACADELFRRGFVPYYGTWCGNIISQRLSLDCGFYPAWSEMFALPLPAANAPVKKSAAAAPADNKPETVPEKADIQENTVPAEEKSPDRLDVTDGTDEPSAASGADTHENAEETSVSDPPAPEPITEFPDTTEADDAAAEAAIDEAADALAALDGKS